MTDQQRSEIMSTLRATRRALGLTQAQVAAMIGTQPGAISLYESGRKQPTLPVLDRWATALGLRLTDNKSKGIDMEHNRGFTLLECLLAMGIFLIGFMGIMGLFSSAVLLQKRTIDDVQSQAVSRNAAALITGVGIDDAALIAALPASADTDGLLYPLPSLSLSDRSYPSAIVISQRKFFWTAMVRDANTAAGQRLWVITLFVMRRGQGRQYDKAVGVWANPTDPTWVPGVRRVDLTLPVTATLTSYNFDNDPRIVRQGDWVTDDLGTSSRVLRASDTGAEIKGLVIGGTPSHIWIGYPSDTGGPSPLKRVTMVVGVIR